MNYDVSDPSDWPLEQWQQLDNTLRCPICKEYFTAAMLLPGCSHNFCSLCLRQAFVDQNQSQKRCPSCRHPAEVRDMKNNRTLDDVVFLLRSVRQTTIDALLHAKLNKNEENRALCSATPKLEFRNTEPQLISWKRPEVLESKNDCFVTEEGTKEIMTCPTCQYDYLFTNEQMNRHLDECLTHSQLFPATKRPRLDSPLNSQTCIFNAKDDLFYAHPKDKKPVKAITERITMPWLRCLKDQQLRDIMNKHNVPCHGDRRAKEKRFVQFVNMWNAACDDKNDERSPEDLINSLLEWERNLPSSHQTKTSDQLDKHMNKYQTEFELLVQSAKARMKENVSQGAEQPSRKSETFS